MSEATELATTRVELIRALRQLRERRSPVVLVPTMGALHEGHRSLLRQARSGARTSVVSIFVNPLQFGSAEDLTRYPRDLDKDLETCAEEGVALVWAPGREVMYPQGDPEVTVSAGPLGEVFEGRARPGHFDGVLTVVTKLLHQVRPAAAVFGAKDAQQLFLVRRAVADLELDVVVEAVDTVRDEDGLALSSRNGRLSPEGRRTATALSRVLLEVQVAAELGGDALLAAAATARATLDATPGVMLDYLALVDPKTFREVTPVHRGPALAVVAAEVEGVRLIDSTDVFLPPAETA